MARGSGFSVGMGADPRASSAPSGGFDQNCWRNGSKPLSLPKGRIARASFTVCVCQPLHQSSRLTGKVDSRSPNDSEVPFRRPWLLVSHDCCYRCWLPCRHSTRHALVTTPFLHRTHTSPMATRQAGGLEGVSARELSCPLTQGHDGLMERYLVHPPPGLQVYIQPFFALRESLPRRADGTQTPRWLFTIAIGSGPCVFAA